MKKVFLIILFILIIGLPVRFVNAGLGHNTHGWAWNDNIGWIAHNSTDNSNVPVFGVHLDDESSTVSGYAWNEVLGYIDFSQAGYSARNRELSGNARILNLTADPVLSLRGVCGVSCNYGVSVDGNGNLRGEAWNSITGYISFGGQAGYEQFRPIHHAEQNPSVSGWAWSGTYGWIALRYTEYDLDYGVNLEDNGNVSGYAWNEGIGWINYNPTGPYPTAPHYSTRWNSSTGELSGWAKALGPDQYGYVGWILMRQRSIDTVSFGVNLSRITGEWSGWAWNDTFGWIDYSGPLTSVQTIVPNSGPVAPVLIAPVNCVDVYSIDPVTPLTPPFSWTNYSALDGSTQRAFRIQINDDPRIEVNNPPVVVTPLVDEIVNSVDSVYTPRLGVLRDYNVTYYWRVQVQSSLGEWSDWGSEGVASATNCFRTPLHTEPACDFSVTPTNPVLDQPTRFTDETQTFGSPPATIDSWNWNFGDGVGRSNLQNPSYTYENVGDYTITLEVVDSDGYSCSTTNETSVNRFLPQFKRVIPR